MIRPERIDFAPAADASAAPNRFAGSVGQDRFLGAVRRFDFRIGAHTLCVETRHRDTPAAVVIPPDAIRILPRADDTPRPAQPTTAEEHLP
jgi:putative spermidine/putrescine transport system ATP-binding protein